MAFMAISIAFFVGIETTFNGGFSVSAKYLSVPLAVGVILFVKININKIKVYAPWSDLNIWLFSILLFYPLILLMSWPYVLATNALLSSDEVIELGGRVDEKFITKGKNGSSYHLRTVDENTLDKAELNVSKGEYENIMEGDIYYHQFFKGAFGIPWHWRGTRPNKTLQVDR